MGIKVEVPGQEGVTVEGVNLEKAGHEVPYLICTDGGERYGTDGQVLLELVDPQNVIVVFDDGRAFPAIAQLRDGVIQCTPTILPPRKEPEGDEYVGAWALPS